ncbi:hypothetical protein [Sphingomonas oryzagri]
MDIEAGWIAPSAIPNMISAWEEMWQLPRITWARWCDVAIDMWVDCVIGHPFIPTRG